LRNWLDWYSTYYGALGVIMAIFFWLLIAATILAHRPWRHRTPAGGPAHPPKRVNRHPS
jgi:hypothetical protein